MCRTDIQGANIHICVDEALYEACKVRDDSRQVTWSLAFNPDDRKTSMPQPALLRLSVKVPALARSQPCALPLLLSPLACISNCSAEPRP
jgi:hypothetical protein